MPGFVLRSFYCAKAARAKGIPVNDFLMALTLDDSGSESFGKVSDEVSSYFVDFVDGARKMNFEEPK